MPVMRILLFSLFLLPLFAGGQDASFSQFYAVGHWYNPARVGAMQESIKAGIHYRRQWTSNLNGFRTNGANVEARIGNSPFSAGLLIIDDKAGQASLKTFQAVASGAYHLEVDRNSFLSAGFQIGFVQRSIRMDGLAWDAQYNGYQYDPALDNKERQFSDRSGSKLDVGLGLYYRSDGEVKWGAGYGFHHLGQEQTFLQNGEDKLGIRHSIQGFAEKEISRFSLRLDGMIQRQRGVMEAIVMGRGEYRFGADSKYTRVNNSSAMRAGVGYRHSGAIIPTVGFEWERKFELSLSYDIMIAGPSAVTGFTGGPEFVLIYRYSTDKRMKIN